MACDAVLISINFWDGGYSEGWGLGGNWGRGIKVRVRIVVGVRAEGFGVSVIVEVHGGGHGYS